MSAWDALLPPDDEGDDEDGGDEVPEHAMPAPVQDVVEPEPEPDVAEHTCHARGCKTAVPPERLMCKRHWLMVPRRLRDLVWQHYRPGQCDDKRPSKAWHEAADAAIAAVAKKEMAAAARELRNAPPKGEPKPEQEPDPQEELPFSESFLETGYATPPEKRPSKTQLQNAWMAEATSRHERERLRIYCEAFATALAALALRRRDLRDPAALRENAWIAGYLLEHGMVRGDKRFETELRQLGVDPETFFGVEDRKAATP